jgi:O-antigen/teichoic acid export membrane protein
MLSNSTLGTSPEPRSLKQRVVHASAWSLAGYGLSLVIRFGSNLLMTRLLIPSMFGVMAIATVVMMGLVLFTDLGLKQSIVQSKRGSEPDFLNTAWAVQIIRGWLLWFIALGISLLMILADHFGMAPKGSVYSDPILPYVIAVVSFGSAIGGLTSTKLCEASRDLLLSRITLNEIVAQLSGLFCMLFWVAIDRSVWALVAGSVCSTFVRVILSHLWLPGVSNRWHWDKLAFHEIFGFGKWIFLSSILGFFTINADRLVLGGMVDSSVLGVYAIAYTIYISIEQIISRIITEVSYPALSTIVRERPVDLKVSSYRFHAVIASFAYFCSGMLMTCGQALIGLLYDHRYAQAGWMLEVLSVALLTVPFQISIQSFMALGMPQLHSRILAVRLILLVAAMPIGIHFFGLPGALWGFVLSQFLSLAPLIAYSIKLRLFDLRQELLFLPVAVVGLGAGYVLTLMTGFWHGI